MLGGDARHLSPLLHEHINMLGRYSVSMRDAVAKGELRPFRSPADTDLDFSEQTFVTK